MMSQMNAPIHSYKNPQIYYQQTSELSADNFGNFYLGNRMCNSNSDLILGSLDSERSNKVSKLRLATLLDGAGLQNFERDFFNSFTVSKV